MFFGLPVWLVWTVAGAVGAYVVKKSVDYGVSPKRIAVPLKDFTHVLRIFPRTPPIPPYYAPNIRRARYPLCWTFVDGDWEPSAENGTATDVTGTPFMAFKICKGRAYGMGSERCDDASPFSGDGGRRTVKDLDEETNGEVWDIKSRKWVKVDDSLAGTWQWFQADWDGGPDWLDRLEANVKKFIPVVVGMAVSFIATPLAGAITAAALEAIIAIADGAPVTDALVQSYKDQLSHEVEKTAYYETYKSMLGTYNQTKSNIVKIRDEAVSYYKGASAFPNAEEKIAAAVDTGIAVARAKILQDAAYEAVRSRLPYDLPDGSDYRPWFEQAMAHSVTLNNWTIAMFGTDGTQLLQWAYKVAGEALDAGRDPIAAVRPKFIVDVTHLFGK